MDGFGGRGLWPASTVGPLLEEDSPASMNTLSRLVPLLNRFGVTKTWKLGRVLPGQRRGAQEWYHYAGQVHVDDMMATGDQLAQDRVENHHGPNVS